MLYVVSTILAGVCWGCISLFLRPLAAFGFSNLQLITLRGLISVVIMLIIILVKNPKLLKIRLRDLWMFLGTGVVSLTFFSICYFKTILEVGTSVAVILLYTSPIFVLFMSLILFKEKMNWKKVIALIMTFAGCILVAGIIGSGKNRLSLKGFLIGLCAGLGYALYSIFSRYALRRYDSMTVTFYTFLFSGISLLPFVHIQQVPQFMSWKSGLLLIGIALVCTSLPYILYTYGLSGLETGKAAILVTIEPLVGTLIGFIVWKEQISFLKILGIVMIFTAIILLSLGDGKKKSDMEKNIKASEE